MASTSTTVQATEENTESFLPLLNNADGSPRLNLLEKTYQTE